MIIIQDNGLGVLQNVGAPDPLVSRRKRSHSSIVEGSSFQNSPVFVAVQYIGTIEGTGTNGGYFFEGTGTVEDTGKNWEYGYYGEFWSCQANPPAL